MHANTYLDRDPTLPAEVLLRLTRAICDTYSLSLVAISDQQAPYLLTSLTAYSGIDQSEQGEMIFGYLYSSLISCRGKVARVDLDPSKVITYLLLRHNAPSDLNIELVAQPSELAMVLLRSSTLFGLKHEVDLGLSELDHLPVNAYLPSDFDNFGASHIPGGRNAIFQIGDDVWCVDDVDASCPIALKPQTPGTSVTCILASLLFPDRTPWFLL